MKSANEAYLWNIEFFRCSEKNISRNAIIAELFRNLLCDLFATTIGASGNCNNWHKCPQCFWLFVSNARLSV